MKKVWTNKAIVGGSIVRTLRDEEKAPGLLNAQEDTSPHCHTILKRGGVRENVGIMITKQREPDQCPSWGKRAPRPWMYPANKAGVPVESIFLNQSHCSFHPILNDSGMSPSSWRALVGLTTVSSEISESRRNEPELNPAARQLLNFFHHFLWCAEVPTCDRQSASNPLSLGFLNGVVHPDEAEGVSCNNAVLALCGFLGDQPALGRQNCFEFRRTVVRWIYADSMSPMHRHISPKGNNHGFEVPPDPEAPPVHDSPRLNDIRGFWFGWYYRKWVTQDLKALQHHNR